MGPGIEPASTIGVLSWKDTLQVQRHLGPGANRNFSACLERAMLLVMYILAPGLILSGVLSLRSPSL